MIDRIIVTAVISVIVIGTDFIAALLSPNFWNTLVAALICAVVIFVYHFVKASHEARDLRETRDPESVFKELNEEPPC